MIYYESVTKVSCNETYWVGMCLGAKYEKV